MLKVGVIAPNPYMLELQVVKIIEVVYGSNGHKLKI